MKNILFIGLLFHTVYSFSQYNYGIDLIQHDARIQGKLNIDSGTSNIFIGNEAGISNISSSSNVFLGAVSGRFNTTGTGNTFLGSATGLNNISGFSNTFVGAQTGFANKTGRQNTYIGNSSGSQSETAIDNVFIGAFSGQETKGSGNTFVGSLSGKESNGSGNVYLGNESGLSSGNGSMNVFIGNQAGKNETNGGRLYIENTNSTQPLIYAQFFQDKVGINWDSALIPPATLSINGTLHISETAKLEPQTAPPSCATNDMGTMYVDTNGILFFCNGTMWKTVQLN